MKARMKEGVMSQKLRSEIRGIDLMMIRLVHVL